MAIFVETLDFGCKYGRVVKECDSKSVVILYGAGSNTAGHTLYWQKDLIFKLVKNAYLRRIFLFAV